MITFSLPFTGKQIEEKLSQFDVTAEGLKFTNDISANGTLVAVTSKFATATIGDLTVNGGIVIDGSKGTKGQVLMTDGTSVYWGSIASSASVDYDKVVTITDKQIVDYDRVVTITDEHTA